MDARGGAEIFERFDPLKIIDHPRCAQHGVGFGLRGGLGVRFFGQIAGEPGQGIGGGVLSGQERGEHVAADIGVGKTGIRRVARGQERLDQVAGVAAQRGVCFHALARLRDETVDRALHFGQVAFEQAVSGQLDMAPPRKNRAHAPVDGGKDLVQMALDGVVAAFDGVDVDAEGQPGGDVHGVAHEFELQVEHFAGRGGTLEARQKAARHANQVGEIALQMGRVEGLHHHAALAFPVRAFGREETGNAEFAKNRFDRAHPAEGAGARAQDARDLGRVVDHQHPATRQVDAKRRAVAARPFLDDQMHARRVEIRQAAHSGQAGGCAKELKRRDASTVAVVMYLR